MISRHPFNYMTNLGAENRNQIRAFIQLNRRQHVTSYTGEGFGQAAQSFLRNSWWMRSQPALNELIDRWMRKALETDRDRVGKFRRRFVLNCGAGMGQLCTVRLKKPA